MSGLKGTEVKMPDINLTTDVAAPDVKSRDVNGADFKTPEISVRIFQINYFSKFIIIIFFMQKIVNS